MKRVLTACAVAALLVFPAYASAQSYNDLRARAMCLEVGATAAEMPGCIQSVKRKMFLQNLGDVLSQRSRRSERARERFLDESDEYFRDVQRSRREYNRQFYWGP